MATARKGSESSEEHEEKPWAADLESVKSEILEALSATQKSSPGRGKARAEPTTDKEVERDAHETIEQAFERLQREKAHDEHHRALSEAQQRAEARREEQTKKAPPEPRKGLASLWEY